MKTVRITHDSGVEVYVGSSRTLFAKGEEPKLSNTSADALVAHGRARLVEDHQNEESENGNDERIREVQDGSGSGEG